MAKKNDWMLGFNSEKQRYIAIPIFGGKSYDGLKAECDKLNQIWDDKRKPKTIERR